MTTRRDLLKSVAAVPALAAAAPAVTKFVRFRRNNAVAYGILEGETIREISAPPFRAYKETGAQHKLSEVRLLTPCAPSKVLAVGANYRSHLGSAKPPSNPEIFYKPITCLQNPEDPIILPKISNNVHYEGEMVVVIGRRAKKVTPEQARQVILGITCGNDVSERDWQNGERKDMQWWRAKGADTFGPMGPVIASGVDSSKLKLTTRLNGKVVQEQVTSDMIFDPPAIVSWISQVVTLMPGDVIFTGTPGHTSKMKPGDVVEVEIENVGILRNVVKAE